MCLYLSYLLYVYPFDLSTLWQPNLHYGIDSYETKESLTESFVNLETAELLKDMTDTASSSNLRYRL